MRAINGFRKCGIFSLDHNVFTDEDYTVAEVTDIPLDLEKNAVPSSIGGSSQHPTAESVSSAGPSKRPTTIPSSSSGPSQYPTGVFSLNVGFLQILCAKPSSGEGSSQCPTTEESPSQRSTDKSSSSAGSPQCSTTEENSSQHPTGGFHISPKDIKPLPKAQTLKQRQTNRTRGNIAIITSSLYKTELAEERRKKEEEV
ncbi:hypothetical protein PR048_013283 [Dryococelus australis]|uniref:Uncharacterized protein n=1 Tax=Dryococelus australis TaxID=614101 RepID=A0ABQ9HRQ5_9NEOP|nr:hypothetical protein PR048_013283 [Dryococelus australis]